MKFFTNMDKRKTKVIEKKLIEQTIETYKQQLKDKLAKTYDDNSAFMVLTDERGKTTDWCLPVSEVIKLID